MSGAVSNVWGLWFPPVLLVLAVAVIAVGGWIEREDER